MFKFIKKLFKPKGNRFTAGALAKKFGLELKGNAKTIVTGIAPIADAGRGDLTFYSTEKNSDVFKILPIETLRETRASIILLEKGQIKNAPKDATLLISGSPRGDIVKMLGEIYREKPRRGIHFTVHIERGVFFRKKRSVYIGPNAVIEKNAAIEPNVHIGAGAFIGRGVILGRGTVIHPGVHIENATIGANCVIYPHATIGKDGFGFTRQNGKNIFIPHVGRVILGDRVSVGSGTCIDRGLMSDTIVGSGTKIDNLCQIAHGVIIGEECFLASGAALAGGGRVGNRVMLGGGASISNKIIIGDDAEIGPQSGIFRNVTAGAKMLGSPATSPTEFFRMFAWLKRQVNKG